MTGRPTTRAKQAERLDGLKIDWSGKQVDGRLGGKMNKEVYRFAFDEANAELTQIVGEFEQLRLRKERVEKVVEALKPLAGADSQGAGGEKKESPSYSY
jgi:hypothetical protein